MVDQITEYFTNYDATQAQETNQEMSYLLKVLPSTLKVQLAKFLYSDAIFMHRFLQDRDDDFYAKYLEELKSEKINKGEYLVKKGNKPESVIFIMQGIVHNQTTARYFEGGQIINQECVINQTLIRDDYVCKTDVTVLKFDPQVFLNIIDQFPDVDEDIKQIIEDKRAIRENNEFAQSALRSDLVRKAIIEDYQHILQDEAHEKKRNAKSLALKLNMATKAD